MANFIKNRGIYKKGTAQYAASYQSGGTYTTNDPIPVFVTETFNDSVSITKLSTTQVQLKAGKKYKLMAHINGILTSNTYVWFTFYDVTGSADIGQLITMTSTTDTSINLRSPTGGGYFVPTVDSTIDLRLATIGGGTYGDFLSQVEIEEVEAVL